LFGGGWIDCKVLMIEEEMRVFIPITWELDDFGTPHQALSKHIGLQLGHSYNVDN
jgi:hypothetical protein